MKNQEQNQGKDMSKRATRSRVRAAGVRLIFLFAATLCGNAWSWPGPPTAQVLYNFTAADAKADCMWQLAKAFAEGAANEGAIFAKEHIIERKWEVLQRCSASTWTSPGNGQTYLAYELRVHNYIKYDPNAVSISEDYYPYGSVAMIFAYAPASLNRGKGVTNEDCDAACLGNPVRFSEGNKVESITDFAAGHDSRFRWVRYYNSSAMMEGTRYGDKWRHSFSRSIAFKNLPGETALVYRDDGKMIPFKQQGGMWVSDADVTLQLALRSDAPGWIVSDDLNGVAERYDANGTLERVEYKDGYFIQLNYDNLSEKRLVLLSDRSGRSISLNYNPFGFISDIRLPDGQQVSYTYQGFDAHPLLRNHVLTAVTHPDDTSKQYQYAPDKIAILEAIIDEQTNEYARFTYNNYYDRAVGTTHAGGAGAYSGVIANQITPTTATIVDPNGLSTKYDFTLYFGINRTTKVTRNCPGACTEFATFTYDANGRPDRQKDFSGRVTDRDYDAQGHLTRIVEAAGTSLARRVETDWHPSFHAPTQRRIYDTAGTVVTRYDWSYNARGEILTESVTDPVTGAMRATSTAYCEQADVDGGLCPLVGLVRQVDGARTDVADVTTYNYRMADEPSCATTPASCAYRKGDLWKITNPLSQSIETLAYDGAGRPRSMLDANGVRTDFEYHARGWLTARKVRGTNDTSEDDDHIMRMNYWPTGKIKRITQPDGTWTEYTYDSAHRLTGVADHIGNTITYVLNAAGERTGEETRDHTGSLRRSLTRLYSTLGQLESQTDAYEHVTRFTYDSNGSLDTTKDALLRETDNDYDALGRLERTLQNATGGQANTVETIFEYDTLDNLTKVIDPNQLSTHYVYNGLGELKSLQSPDTGTTGYTYDAAGNREAQIDARDVQTQYGYDALNRITAVTYPSDSGINTTYVYDVAQPDCAAGETFLIGRLAKMTDNTNDSTTYCYDRFGQLTRKTQRTQGKTFALQWQYAANGRLQSMTYPDGSVVDYLYDEQGRMVEMGVTPERQSRQKVAYDVLYHPWSGPARWRSMADRMVVRTQNQNGQPGIVQAQDAAGVPIAGISLGYEFDEVGNLKRLRDGNQADPPARIYGYDPLNRLTEAKDASNVVWQSYSYDKTGNRQTAGWRDIVAQEDCTGAPPGGPCTPLPPTTQWATDAYTYHADTHRVFTRTGRERNYDGAGNLVLDAAMGVTPIDPPPGGGETESAAYAGTMQTLEDEGGDDPSPPGAMARAYSYNAANRMSGTSLGGEHLMNYRYNGRGERVYRQGSGKTVHTAFDEAGRWIGDYDENGAAIQQAIWLGDLPVGLLAKDNGIARLFHVEADALGSPRAVIDPTRGANGTVVWHWDLAGEAFGNDKPNEDPDGDDIAFVFDMRYPGQQYDSASELNYNYFRDYEAGTGRYVESDPIGLKGGG